MPRPDWYFYFLFYLLRIFKWPESVFLGTVGVPTIALMLLIALPFLDRRRVRRPSQRPVAMVAAVLTILSMGVLTWKGATAKEALASEVKQNIPRWIKAGAACRRTRFPGRNLFAVAGCTACHTYDGAGGSQLGAPDLTDDRLRETSGSPPDQAPQRCPSSVTPGLADAVVLVARPGAPDASSRSSSKPPRARTSGVESGGMRRLLLLALLVPLAAACGWSPFPSGHSSAQVSSVQIQVTTSPVYTEAPSSVPRWIKVEHLPQKAIPGAKLFATAGCTACHTYAGSGSRNLDAPP